MTERERNLVIKLVGWYCILNMAFTVTTFIIVASILINGI